MNDDPRFSRPLYTVPEAARLLRVPGQTLRNWIVGYAYSTERGPARAEPVIDAAGDDRSLSFVNLIEALTLSGFREMHVPMQRVRRALEYIRTQAGSPHLLANERVLSDGLDLFWEFQEREGEPHLVNISRSGQKAFPDAVMRYLREVEWGDDRFAERWWPGGSARAGLVVVDPRRSFGAPVIAGTGIRVEDVFARFSAGDSIEALTHDYGVAAEQVEAAIRLEASLLEPLAA